MQHVYWTRMFIISTVEKINDLSMVTDQPLENPKDFSRALNMFYGLKISDRFMELLTEHLKIGGDLVAAVNAKKNRKGRSLKREMV